MRNIIEPLLNLAGYGMGWILDGFPVAWGFALQQRILKWLSGKTKYPMDSQWERRLHQAKFLKETMEKIFGRSPAVLCVISHPPVGREVDALNFKLMEIACAVVKEICPFESPIRQLVAIDPFALDAVSFFQEGLYAGVMRSLHLALDRQPWLRTSLQGRLFGSSAYGWFVHLLVRSLRRREAVVAALSGGVYENTRLLYTAREYFSALRRRALKRGASIRNLESKILALLAEGEDLERGEVSSEAESALKEHASQSGFEHAEMENLMHDFKEEFRRGVPWRRRFFEFLAGRVVQGGTPLLLVPLSHGRHENPQIRLGNAVALLPADGGPRFQEVQVRFMEVSASGEMQEDVKPVGEFAKDWISENFI
ncbi:MAG: hypothetical protein HY400_00230 [Elusimicrobia bacterium]|nr:hypothetical protein [Elusimicrobiota bacterium]